MKRFWVGWGETKEVADEGDLDGVANDIDPKPPRERERERVKTLKSHFFLFSMMRCFRVFF